PHPSLKEGKESSNPSLRRRPASFFVALDPLPHRSSSTSHRQRAPLSHPPPHFNFSYHSRRVRHSFLPLLESAKIPRGHYRLPSVVSTPSPSVPQFR
ncbi:hypothetical protein PIB30_056729, partial [Stylosanthes scabra]|nr:hypothetical protein [Stylosanthes scabra]